MAAFTKYRAEIAYSSYDPAQKCVFYSIQVHRQLPNSAQVDVGQIKRRRFRDFLLLYQDSYARYEDEIGSFPCSKLFSTDPEIRQGKLEHLLNQMIEMDLKLNEFKLTKPLKKFLGLDSPTAFPDPIKTFEEFDLESVLERKVKFGWQMVGLAMVAFAMLKGLGMWFGLLMWVGECGAMYAYQIQLERQRRLQFIQDQRVRDNAHTIDLSLVCKEKDGTLSELEREQLPLLRARLVDFYLGNNQEYDQWYVTTFGPVLGSFKQTLTGKGLDNTEQRKLVWNQNVFKDYQLALFSRFNQHKLDLAEAQARFALTTRLAFQLDTIHELITPRSEVIEYMGSKLLNAALGHSPEQRTKRLTDFWLRDRQGALLTFARLGRVPTGEVFTKLFHGNEVDMVTTSLWYLEMFKADLEYWHEQSEGRLIPASLTVVADLSDFSLAEQMSTSEVLSLVKQFVPLFTPGYSGLLKKLIVINAPWYVNMLIGIVSPFIPKDIMDSVVIHGKLDLDKHLRPYVEDSNIPKYLGGELVGENGDEFCLNRFSPQGPFLK
ncbi:hypothetical protein BASA81_003185 [Batrachochytrium salamandrivorans]|nr:hypothetical protein BASA81_003185 [Batrachochytrium salamandrivorans]